MTINGAKKIMAWLTLVLFSGQSAALTAPEALLSTVPQAQVSSRLGSFSADTLASSLRELPAELGNLRETFIPAAKAGDDENSIASRYPVVLHVQDAHANGEAQARIKDILEWIHKTSQETNVQGPVVVALEGSVGKLHPEYLDMFPEFPDANEALVKDLSDKGELTGSDLYLWEQYKSAKNPETKSKTEMIFWGAEDPELYRRNLDQFRGLLFKRTDIDALLQPFESLLAIAQSRILNPQLRDFLKESERTEVLALAVLKHAKPTLGIDLEDKIEQLRFPNLTRFSYLREIEPLLDAELARMDWESLKAAFEKNKIPEELTERFGHLFSEKGESGLSLRQTAEDVFSHPGAKKIRFRDYPHLLQWASYRILAQEISSADFISELEQLKQAVMTKLSQKKEEKDFIELYRDYLLFRKVLHLDVTREEYAETESAPEKFVSGDLSRRLFLLVKRDRELESAGKEVRKNEPLLQDYYRRASLFYRGAGTRDLEIMENALSFYQSRLREEIHPSETKSAAPGILVIVTGGFHSEGMTGFLKDRGIPHLVFVPRISKIEEDSLYFKVMRRDQADLSGYFDKNPLNKQESLLLKGLIEKAAPELTQRYGIASSDIPGWIEKVIQRHPVLSARLSALVFSGEGKPFVRISAQSQRTDAVKVGNQSVSEVALLNTAGTGTGSYGDLASQVFEPSLTTSVTVTPGLSGHSTFQKAPPAGGTLAKQLGNLDVTMGPIDAGNLELLRSAANQFEGLKQILNPSTSQIGPGGLIVPSAARSELRATEGPGGAPSIGEISLDKMTLNQEEINRIVETYDLITITADVQDGLSYGDYYKRFEPFLAAAGKALKALRTKEKRAGAEPRHKVFMMKPWTEVGSTENFFDTIKWSREPSSEEGNNDFFFDVVFQPDFSYRDESGREASDQVLFGIRDYGKTLTESETARRDRTIALLRKAFQGSDFMNSAKAERMVNEWIGLSRHAASAREELRQSPLSVFEKIVRNSGPEPLTTAIFRKEVAALPADAVPSLKDFLQLHPELVSEHEVSEVVTASFVPADWSQEDRPGLVSYIQLRLIAQETTTDEEVLAVKQSREALGNFAWLLDSGKTPAQIILPLEKGVENNEELFRVAMILAAADKSMRFTFLVEDSPQQARAQAVRMAERRLELGIPDASVLERFKFVPSAGSEDVRVIKQIYSENKEIPSAVITQRRAWLEKMGYIPRMSRILNNGLDRNTAVMVTAALLRQLKEQYDPVSINDLLNQYDLNVDELVENVARMIQVINHLATQA